MFRIRLSPLVVTWLLAGCAGGEFSSGNSNGTGGAGGGSGTNCASLGSVYLKALALARVCDPNAEGVCDGPQTMRDRCGCEVPVNPNLDATKTAESALQAYEDAGCQAFNQPGCGATTCYEVTGDSVVKCQESGTGSSAWCSWSF